MTPHERIEDAPINADGSTRCLICQGTTAQHRPLEAAGIPIPCPHADDDELVPELVEAAPVATYRPSFLMPGDRLPNHARVSLIVALAGVDERELHSSHSHALARLDGKQLDAVELLIAAAVQNTSRTFLESSVELVADADRCVCADEPDGICLGVRGESDACLACLERDPQLPCLADVEVHP